MRRRLMRFLPMFLLALTVQVLAPVGACLATAIAASDPLAAAVLCRGTPSNNASDQKSNPHVRHGSCAVCAAATPFTPSVPQPEVVNVTRHIDRVVWQAFAPEARVARLATSAQARAPPILS